MIKLTAKLKEHRFLSVHNRVKTRCVPEKFQLCAPNEIKTLNKQRTAHLSICNFRTSVSLRRYLYLHLYLRHPVSVSVSGCSFAVHISGGVWLVLLAKRENNKSNL